MTDQPTRLGTDDLVAFHRRLLATRDAFEPDSIAHGRCEKIAGEVGKLMSDVMQLDAGRHRAAVREGTTA